MGCKEYRLLLMDTALGTLGNERKAELQTHLSLCSKCPAELARMKELMSAIDRGVADTVNLEPSPRFAAQVRQRRSQHQTAPRKLFGFWLPVAAGSLVGVTLLAILLRPQTVRPPDSNSRRLAPEIAGTNAISAPARPATTATTPAAHVAANAAPGVIRSRILESRGKSSEAVQPSAPGIVEVIVPPGEWQAVTRFAAAASRGQINTGGLREGIETSYNLPVVDSVEIPISKIDQVGVQEAPGVMQDR